MQTCRHFRYQVPRECADELRDADPEPCPVCDALPHRRALSSVNDRDVEASSMLFRPQEYLSETRESFHWGKLWRPFVKCS